MESGMRWVNRPTGEEVSETGWRGEEHPVHHCDNNS